jgi:hypothetical protein
MQVSVFVIVCLCMRVCQARHTRTLLLRHVPVLNAHVRLAAAIVVRVRVSRNVA